MENNVTSNMNIYHDWLNQYSLYDEIESKSNHENETIVLIDTLPLDVIKHIFTYLRTVDLPRAARTCKNWDALVRKELQGRIKKIEESGDESLFKKLYDNKMYHTCLDYFFRFKLDYYNFDVRIYNTVYDVKDSKNPLEFLKSLPPFLLKQNTLIKKIHKQQQEFLPFIFEQAQKTNDLLLMFKFICYFPQTRHLIGSAFFPNIDRLIPSLNVKEEKSQTIEEVNNLKTWVNQNPDSEFLIEKCLTSCSVYSDKTKMYLDIYLNCVNIEEEEKIIKIKRLLGSIGESYFPQRLKNFSSIIETYKYQTLISLIEEIDSGSDFIIINSFKNIYKIYSMGLIDDNFLNEQQFKEKISLLFDFFSGIIIESLRSYEIKFYINYIESDKLKNLEIHNQLEEINLFEKPILEETNVLETANLDEILLEAAINESMLEIGNNSNEVQSKNMRMYYDFSEDELDQLQNQEEFSEEENLSDSEELSD